MAINSRSAMGQFAATKERLNSLREEIVFLDQMKRTVEKRIDELKVKLADTSDEMAESQERLLQIQASMKILDT